ncbi:GntR family transcriptional regulator [Brooklawnia propionicigenes]
MPKEDELMELFSVGKSTVREAVRSLSYIGMLVPIRGVGSYVSSLPAASCIGECLTLAADFGRA